MISLCYISASKDRFNDDQLVELLNTCHLNNSALDVTGLLLYNGRGTFLQVLEGEESTVNKLYERIKKDDRHSKVTCLSNKNINERSFPSWKMGFRNLKKLSLHESTVFSEFLEQKNFSKAISPNASSAYSMLYYFKEKANELIF